MTISDEKAYKHIRKGITGGISNVINRRNIKGEDYIRHLTYNIEENNIKSYESQDKINHCFGLDFNSLYPSAFSSTKHEFCKYTGNKMYMPGVITNYFSSIGCGFRGSFL